MAESEQLNMIQALNNALDLYMEREELATVMGEDVASGTCPPAMTWTRSIRHYRTPV